MPYTLPEVLLSDYNPFYPEVQRGHFIEPALRWELAHDKASLIDAYRHNGNVEKWRYSLNLHRYALDRFLKWLYQKTEKEIGPKRNFIPHAHRPGWWVGSYAKPTGHRSNVGPFTDVIEAAEWAKENRPPDEWRNITIVLRQNRKR